MTDDVSQVPEAATIEALNQMRSQAETLVASIREQVDSAATRNQQIEEGRQYAERTKAELESGLVTARAQLEEASKQLEAARAMHNGLLEIQAAAQTATNTVVENRAQTTSILETVQQVPAKTTELAHQAEVALGRIAQMATEIATKSEHIEQGRVHADSVRSQLDELLTQSQQSAGATSAQVEPAQLSLNTITDIRTAAQEAKTVMDSVGEAIIALRKQSEGHVTVTERLAGTADELESRVKTSEAHLVKLQETSEERLKQIEKLLLGATNAGLASAFDTRSKTFQKPERIWQWVFIGSLGAMLAIAIWEAITVGELDTTPGYDELARMLLHRIPFFLPLVWLAIHSSRQASLAKRMEEEYAFKATISTSFEGYRRQMAEISKDLPETSPLAQLCTDTLKAISKPPGFVYDKHRMDPTPGTAAAELVKPLADAASALAQKVPSAKTG